MTTYSTIDYRDGLTTDQINFATPLTFEQYVPPVNSIGNPLNWDFRAFFSTSVDNTGTRDIFAFTSTSGATYDIFSQSFFDPLVLQLFDDQGRIIATDDGSGAAGTDHIRFTASYDGNYYLDASWRKGFTSVDKYASIAVYEDLDTIPPVFTGSAPAVTTFSPSNSTTGVPIDSNIVLTFNETIQTGSGSIALITAGNVLVESFDAASSSNLTITDKILTINPTHNLSYNTQYFVILDSGVVKDTANHDNAEITAYGFSTAAPTPGANADRIFNWGENQYPTLFPDHPLSQVIFGYHARIYANGNALGEQNNHIYFYDGGTEGITLVGATADFLPQAISAGY